MTEAGQSATSNYDETYSDIADEHRRIKELVAELRDLKNHVHLVPLLEELNTLLGDHFDRETRSGGFYDAIGAAGETHRKDLEVLNKEHVLIGSAVRGLLARAQLEGQAHMPEILREVSAVAECIHDHEQTETRIAQELFSV